MTKTLKTLIMSSNISPERRQRISKNFWKKLFNMVILFIFFLMLIFTPFAFINVKEKSLYLRHKKEFIKKKVKIDSIYTHDGNTRHNTKLRIFDIYYNNNQDMISLTDYRTIVFSLKQEREDFKDFWKIYVSHTPFFAPRNDSIWVWRHAELKDRYAMKTELNLDTSGFLLEIVLNIIMIIVVISGATWQIKEWIKLKSKK